MPIPPKGTPLDPRLGRFHDVGFDGLATFRVDSDAILAMFQQRAEQDGFAAGSGPSDLRENKASQAGLIALRALTVFQNLFSADIAKAIEDLAELSYRNARKFIEEHPEVNDGKMVTAAMLASSVTALPPAEREELINARERSLRGVLIANEPGAPVGTRPLKPEEAHLLLAFRDLVSNGRDVSAASRILVRQFQRGASRKSATPKSLLRRVRRVEKRAVDLGLTDAELRELAMAKNKNFTI